MNVEVPINARGAKNARGIKKARAARVKMRRRDQAFLPGALEILETPPAPLAYTMMGTIILFFVVAVAWSWFGRIDIIAVAQGKIQPSGQVKTIQSLETGRVLANLVANGRHVAAGEVLLALDPREAKAERDEIDANLRSFQAEVRRRQTAIQIAAGHGLESDGLASVTTIDWSADIPPAIKAREQRVLDADLTQLEAQLSFFQAQTRQKDAERRKLSATIKAQQDLIATLQERVAMRQALQDTNAYSKSNLLDSIEALRTQQTTLVQETGQVAEIEANLDVIDRDSRKTRRNFIADNSQKLDEAERQVASLTEKRAHAEAKLENLVVKSPIEGTVQSSIVTTPGQVVSPGEEVMRIVPDGATLEIESYLPNKDIAFVKVGQAAIVKVASVPFTRYGTIDAVVTRVAHDAIPEPDADQAEQNPARPSRSLMPAGADRVQNLVYAVTLRPLKTTLDVDGAPVALGPGMEVTAEIKTGARRIIDYLFAPLAQTRSEALRER